MLFVQKKVYICNLLNIIVVLDIGLNHISLIRQSQFKNKTNMANRQYEIFISYHRDGGEQ